MNLFLGKLVTDQVFPYPDALNEESRETLSLLVGPTQKFFEVKTTWSFNEPLCLSLS